MSFLEKISPTCYRIKKGFVPNMRVRREEMERRERRGDGEEGEEKEEMERG